MQLLSFLPRRLIDVCYTLMIIINVIISYSTLFNNYAPVNNSDHTMSTEKYMSAAEKLIPVFATKQPYGQGARLGTLSLAGRKPINTPHYLALTSRGLIPHITQDNLKSHFNVRSVHFPLEDCK